MSDSEDHIDSPDAGDDLFGDGDSGASDQEQPLSDHGLDSDHDEGQQRYGDDEAEGDSPETKAKIVMDVKMFRHRTPKPQDGTV